MRARPIWCSGSRSRSSPTGAAIDCGSMSREVATCFAWHTSGITTIDETMRREVLVGTSGSRWHQLPFAAVAERAHPDEIQTDLGIPTALQLGFDGTRRGRRLLQLHLGQ